MEKAKQTRVIQLTNTLTGKKETLETFKPGQLSLYSCGPTVYGLIHIGNLRGGLTADMFYKYFQRVGYDVTYVRNYTDVDDKIITRSREEGMSPEALAQKYTIEVEKDYAVAGMAEPTHKTTVTTHIAEIISMIEKIIEEGKAYVADDGEVLFSIAAFPTYGKLSHKKIDDLVAGIRVEVSQKKRNPLDFTLWKPAKPGEPNWDSPWGKGRPGWHIECSAMATKWLGDQIDVHHGGEDLIFPHHENEIAQTEGATGKDPFVRYWLHHAFLTISKEKMSKSIGNVFNARDFLTQFSGEIARYMLLSVHYRSMIDFGTDTIEQALMGLHRIYEAKARAMRLLGGGRARADIRAEGAWGSFLASCETARTEIDANFAHDFNTPGVLGALFSLIRDFNRTLQEPLAQATPAAVLGAQELIRVMEEDVGGVLGIGRSHPEKVLEDITRIRLAQTAQAGGSLPTEKEILEAIQQRVDARKAKDFVRADVIRKELESKGVLIKDGPQGTSWQYK
jgi:cysteinyl-tRNA synthetase